MDQGEWIQLSSSRGRKKRASKRADIITPPPPQQIEQTAKRHLQFSAPSRTKRTEHLHASRANGWKASGSQDEGVAMTMQIGAA